MKGKGIRLGLREEQQRAARELIARSALEVFLERGYVGATISDIAERADVARQTIYNLYESKAALLIAAIEDRVVGRDVRSQSDDREAVRTSKTADEIIERFAASTAGIASRSVPILRIAREAAAIDGEVAKYFETNEEHRYEAHTFLVRVLAEHGSLRTDIAPEELARGLWMLASPHNLLTAIDAGWDVDAYERWLTATVKGLLLAER